MSQTLNLPLSAIVNGAEWKLFAIDFPTPDGKFSAYIQAISFEHANAMLFDLKEHGKIERCLCAVKPQ